MANYAKRVSQRTFHGEHPTLSLSNDHYADLEAIYEAISKEARSDLLSICGQYFRRRRAELNAERFSEVRDLFESIKKAFAPFEAFAYGSFVPWGDAAAELKGILSKHFEKCPVPIRDQDLLVLAQRRYLPAEADTGLALVLSEEIIMQFAQAMALALHKAEKDIRSQEQSGSKGFAPGDAFPGWLVSMKEWARRYGYLHGAFNANQKPSRFSHFLFRLNKLFEKDVGCIIVDHRDPTGGDGYSESVNSVGAIAQRLKLAIRVGS